MLLSTATNQQLAVSTGTIATYFGNLAPPCGWYGLTLSGRENLLKISRVDGGWVWPVQSQEWEVKFLVPQATGDAYHGDANAVAIRGRRQICTGVVSLLPWAWFWRAFAVPKLTQLPVQCNHNLQT